MGSELLGTSSMTSLAQTILQIALSGNTEASKAVLQSILALSSLHLSGDLAASVHKTSAIHLLQRSIEPESSSTVSMQTFVASMLLYLYEVFTLSTVQSMTLTKSGFSDTANPASSPPGPSTCLERRKFSCPVEYRS